jgi:hypothetical protein
MSRTELPRAGLIKAALAGHITNCQAATALHLTVRQVQRLKQHYEAGGPSGSAIAAGIGASHPPGAIDDATGAILVLRFRPASSASSVSPTVCDQRSTRDDVGAIRRRADCPGL